MTADYRKLLVSLKDKQYAPVYLIDGEETFYLDLLTDWFENKIIAPEEKDFNLMVLYGKDSSWQDVVNASRRFPMFAERQVVILREAGQMKDLGELVGYVEHPSPTTVLLIEHPHKKMDGRSKLVTAVKKKGFYFNSEKLKDEQVPEWIRTYGKDQGFEIDKEVSELMATNLGNHLLKIGNELAKIRINEPAATVLDKALVEKHIGLNRDYNIFELPETLISGDKLKLYRMVRYFTANAKVAAMPLVIGIFYSYFSKLYQGCFLKSRPAAEATKAMGMFGERFIVAMQCLSRNPPDRIEYCLRLLGEYSAYSVGMGYNEKNEGDLLKEFIGKLEMALE